MSTTAAADCAIGNDGVDVGMMAAANTTTVDKFPVTTGAASVNQSQPQPGQEQNLCVHCSYDGSDIFFTCPNRCSYHARCLDLASVQQHCLIPSNDSSADEGNTVMRVNTCLNCRLEATKLEMLPLPLDTVIIGGSSSSQGGYCGIGKRPHPTESDSNQGYDLNTPRTGRWAPTEIKFRDALISHFLSGSLPLRIDYKLLDFLSDILKSKQSRLTKKMKHANLSMQRYCCVSGFLFKQDAVELSRLEQEFTCSLPNQEHQEIKFHMSRLWRDHLADRLSLYTIPFDPNSWIQSVDCLEKRLVEKQEIDRMVKRRILIGKAWSVDSKREDGVFIDGLEHGDDVDFDSLISSLVNDSGSGATLAGGAEMKSVYSSFVNGSEQNDMKGASSATSDTSDEDYSSSLIGGDCHDHRLSVHSPSSSSEPNFRFGAPFLAWIISYVERTNLPFEHVDIWCPSSLPSATHSMIEPSLSTLGSGVNVPPNCRLYFAGSASSSRQMVPSNNGDLLSDNSYKSSLIPVPMTSDEIESLSLFGHYSEKFSFSNGCGMPGRVFRSGQPEWDQNVSNASPASFERRGGAIQFGIQTAAAIPLRSSNVGRIVLAFYSRRDRERDDSIVEKVMRDVQAMNPCPRYKLIVDMGERNAVVGPTVTSDAATAPVCVSLIDQHQNQGMPSALPPQSQASNVSGSSDETKDNIRSLISFLGENMPSNDNSPLSSQVHNIMSLRLVLLRPNRTHEENHLVESMLVLFESYLSANRSAMDTTLMLARDFAFHNLQITQIKTTRNLSHQQKSPPHRIVPMPSEQTGLSNLSLDYNNRTLPEVNCLRGQLSSFSLTSIDHSKSLV
ncbi:hypothetical protein ACHAWX_004303 [Stephanocyclus meneghinianus]